jgi:serine/threonine-protein kinase mTOR
MKNIVNMAEFMEMNDKRLPLDIHLLARCAAFTSMFAKSLHYRELEFNSKHISPNGEVIEALITINNQLGNNNHICIVLLLFVFL